MDSGKCKVNKGELYFEIDGSGEPVVLIHGFSLDSRMWQQQIEYLKNHFRVVAYDMRGFGKSSLPNGKYSHHEDLLALLDHLEIEKVNLVGLSLGGEIAIDFSIAYPNRVSKLVVASSSLGGFKSTVDWDVHAREVGVEKAKENWLSHQVFESTRDNPKAFKLLKQILNDYSGWHWENSDPREKLSPPASERLNEIKSPTLIVLGKKDLDYYHQIARVLQENVADSELEIIEDAGHMVNIEQKMDFNELLGEFLHGEIIQGRTRQKLVGWTR